MATETATTHRAQMGERFAREIAADLRLIAAGTDVDDHAKPLMVEAAAKLETLINELAAAERARDLALPFLRDGALAEHHSKCGESSQWDIRRCEDAHCLERAHLLEAHGLLPKEWGAYLAAPAERGTANPTCQHEYPAGKAMRDRNPGHHTRIVECEKPTGHDGDHGEVSTGSTWPQDDDLNAVNASLAAGYKPDPECECDGKCRWCAHMGCEACCDSYANGDHGVKEGSDEAQQPPL